jgi:chemotaxis response regulator CheB
MFPAMGSVLSVKDFETIRNTDVAYADLLSTEYNYCKSHLNSIIHRFKELIYNGGIILANQGNKLKKDPKKQKRVPIVGVGSSAGGLEALGKMFQNMPTDSGVGFVLIQHLDPSHKSSMVELLSRYTDMEVLEIKDGMHVEPNKLYVTPPNKNVVA